MTLLVGASLGGGPGATARALSKPLLYVAHIVSLALAAGAAAWLAWRWPALRTPWWGLSAAVLAGLAALMPSLGAVLLVLAMCASSGRWRIAAAAGGAAAWIIGAFYYQLAFPLATKALILAGAGALLALIAWLAMRSEAVSAAAAPLHPPAAAAGRIGVAVAALAVLAVANIGIWQKETLIAEGRPVFVELAPVDPRSLLQGDYMRLNFRLPEAALRLRDEAGARRPQVVGKIDEKGRVQLTHLHDGAPLAADEIAIELTPRAAGPTLVTDAWYFKEGEADRWAQAKYGEFRVDASGKALLVGMRGPALEAL